MRFIFLGTGTSSGVPVIGCACAVCTSADPRDRRLRTGAALEFTDPQGRPRTILIDATPDLRQQVLERRIGRCDAVLFTHNHVDHTFGLDDIRRFNALQGGPIDVFADGHTLEHLRRVYKHIFEKEHNVNDSFVATLIAHAVAPGEPFDLFGLRITPLRLLHGRAEILGYRFDPPPGSPAGPLPLAYCTDVNAIPPETWPRLRGLRTLVLDALRHRRHPTHFTVDEAVGVAERLSPQRTYFIHMTHDLPHEATDRSLPDGVRLAYDGLTLDGPGDVPSTAS
ncbi:MAG: MBL fold metallo-hydrolase [Phycisphaerae bacterium]|nr:MBL fold metallo-hydrolase [Phycisphaerae bacterium]